MAVPQRKDEDLNQGYGVAGEAVNDPKYTTKTKPSKGGEVVNLAEYKKRRVDADRTDLNRPDATRNIKRTSSMPGAPGSRPGLIEDSRGTNPNPTTDKIRRAEIESSGVGAEYRGGKAVKPKTPNQSGVRAAGAEYGTAQPKSMGLVARGAKTQKQRIKLRKKFGKKSTSARIRVGAANTIISFWGVPLYFFFQLPFAFLNILFFLSMYAVSSLLTIQSDDWWTTKAFKSIFGAFVDALSWGAGQIKDLTGYDLSGINPGSFWALTVMVMFGFAALHIFLMYIQYKLFFLNPLSGRGEAAKYGSVIIMIFGYLFPLFNLLPWFGLWAIVVWKYPK